MPAKRGLPRGLPTATKAQKAADKGVKIRRTVVGSNRFTPDEALWRPARFVGVSHEDRKHGRTTGAAVTSTPKPVMREKLATEQARTSRERAQVYVPSTPGLEETKVKIDGVKRTQVRVVRTLEMGDEPLPQPARRYL